MNCPMMFVMFIGGSAILRLVECVAVMHDGKCVKME